MEILINQKIYLLVALWGLFRSNSSKTQWCAIPDRYPVYIKASESVHDQSTSPNFLLYRVLTVVFICLLNAHFLYTGLFGFCHMSDNCTSKFAMVGMMESLDHELTLAGYDGVNTTIVFPASINTALYAKSRHL